MIFLDTHAVVWLATGRLDRLGARVRQAIQEDDPVISPICLLELQLLREIGRLRVPVSEVVSVLTERIGLRVSTMSFRAVIGAAAGEAWTRDPFDRLIVANARAEGGALASKDAQIRAHYPLAFW